MRKAAVPLLFLAAWMSACAALFPRPEAPRLTVADLKFLHVGLFEQKFRILLRVQNPNRFDISVEGLDYELRVEDAPFATGVGKKPVTIPGYGEEILEVEGFGNIGEALLRLFDLHNGIPDKLRYRLKGHVRLARGPSPLAFDYRGEFSLGGARERSDGT